MNLMNQMKMKWNEMKWDSENDLILIIKIIILIYSNFINVILIRILFIFEEFRMKNKWWMMNDEN